MGAFLGLLSFQILLGILGIHRESTSNVLSKWHGISYLKQLFGIFGLSVNKFLI